MIDLTPQIDLYAEFEPCRLLDFLKFATDYDPQKVRELAREV